MTNEQQSIGETVVRAGESSLPLALPANWSRMGRFRQRYWLWRNDCGYGRWDAFWMALR